MTFWNVHEPGHRIPYMIAYAPSEDSDQPARPRSLIWVFAGPSLDSQGSKASRLTAKTLIRLCSRAGWSESSLVAQAILWEILYPASYLNVAYQQFWMTYCGLKYTLLNSLPQIWRQPYFPKYSSTLLTRLSLKFEEINKKQNEKKKKKKKKKKNEIIGLLDILSKSNVRMANAGP